jgi:hypothetical protein
MLAIFQSINQNIKIKIYRTIILAVVYGCETWSLTLREERRLRVFENRLMREYFGRRKTMYQGSGKNYTMRSFMLCTAQQNAYYLGGQRKKVEMGGERGTYGAEERCMQGFGGETEGKRQL